MGFVCEQSWTRLDIIRLFLIDCSQIHVVQLVNRWCALLVLCLDAGGDMASGIQMMGMVVFKLILCDVAMFMVLISIILVRT